MKEKQMFVQQFMMMIRFIDVVVEIILDFLLIILVIMEME